MVSSLTNSHTFPYPLNPFGNYVESGISRIVCRRLVQPKHCFFPLHISRIFLSSPASKTWLLWEMCQHPRTFNTCPSVLIVGETGYWAQEDTWEICCEPQTAFFFIRGIVKIPSHIEYHPYYYCKSYTLSLHPPMPKVAKRHLNHWHRNQTFSSEPLQPFRRLGCAKTGDYQVYLLIKAVK